jgi:hypothetical protein
MPLRSAGTDHGNQSPQPSTAAIWARVNVKKAQPSGGKYPRPALANRATNGMSIQVRTAMIRSDQKDANSNSSDQPGISTAVPMPSPIAKTKRLRPNAQYELRADDDRAGRGQGQQFFSSAIGKLTPKDPGGNNRKQECSANGSALC